MSEAIEVPFLNSFLFFYTHPEGRGRSAPPARRVLYRMIFSPYSLCVPPEDFNRNRQGFFNPSEAHAMLTPINTAYTQELEAQRAV